MTQMLIDGILHCYIHHVVQTATKYANLAHRESATSMDMMLALKFEAVNFQERPNLSGQVALWTEFVQSEEETPNSDSDSESFLEFCFIDPEDINDPKDKLFASDMHEIHRTWDEWAPSDKTQRMLKELIGNWSENFSFLL